ncbi:MAG: hypothetical protein QOI31_1697 [Solirubrobacterales bacterium]|nr:hypothetical protein [Solirubrobacterales bacterium]
MSTTALAKARQILNERISELETEKAELEGALRAIDGCQTSRASSKRSAPSSKSRGKRGRRRVSRSEREAQLLELARRKPSAKNAEIARELGVSPAYVSMLVTRMTASGQLKRDNGALVIGK